MDKTMRQHKYFLAPDLSLTSLSRLVGTNRTYLSQLISYSYGCNFCSYINKLRIDEMMSQGESALETEESLYNMALVCGFNNKRTFNRAFLREKGVLPADFVARHKRLSLQDKNQLQKY